MYSTQPSQQSSIDARLSRVKPTCVSAIMNQAINTTTAHLVSRRDGKDSMSIPELYQLATEAHVNQNVSEHEILRSRTTQTRRPHAARPRLPLRVVSLRDLRVSAHSSRVRRVERGIY